MRQLLSLVNDIAPLVKIGWLIFFVWALVQIAWYRRARVVTWGTRLVTPLPRPVAMPSRTPAPASGPIESAPEAPASMSAAAASLGTPAPKRSRRRRRGVNTAAVQA